MLIVTILVLLDKLYQSDFYCHKISFSHGHYLLLLCSIISWIIICKILIWNVFVCLYVCVVCMYTQIRPTEYTHVFACVYTCFFDPKMEKCHHLVFLTHKSFQYRG